MVVLINHFQIQNWSSCPIYALACHEEMASIKLEVRSHCELMFRFDLGTKRSKIQNFGSQPVIIAGLMQYAPYNLAYVT